MTLKATGPGSEPVAAAGTSPHITGCMVCGAELVYRTTAAEHACALCGERRRTTATCPSAHYVCDRCHGEAVRTAIQDRCATVDDRDPVALASALMRIPGAPMHGPEHHFLVAAALLAAHGNVTGQRHLTRERLAEARRRADAVPGGFCGIQGACGAAIGTGIYASVVTGATPLSRDAWGIANRMTARALSAIGRVGGPRCCKRTTWLALLAAARATKEELGVALPTSAPRCDHQARNAQCRERACPFDRRRRAVAPRR